MTFTPFYSEHIPSRGIFIDCEMVETTRPVDVYRIFMPTGRRRAYVYGWRVPVRFAMFLNYARWRLA